MGLHVRRLASASGEGIAVAQKKIFAHLRKPRIDVKYTPEPGDLSNKVVFIQVMRELLDGVASVPSKLDTDFAFQDADTTADFYHVDYFSGENDPYYNGDDAGLDVGTQGDALLDVPSTMNDSPNYNDDVFPDGKTQMKYEFRTAAYSAGGADAGKYYRFVDWTYSKKKGHADQLALVCYGHDPGPKFKAAVDLWCGNHGFHLPTPEAPDDDTVYVVKAGDCLSKIAQAFYGNAQMWPRIYNENRDVIGPNPNLIFPGQVLTIPV